MIERVQRWMFTVGVTAASRGFRLRDWLVGFGRRIRAVPRGERICISSGGRRLDAVWVPAGEGRPVVLVCHGIGETVDGWRGVQSYLEARDVGSLVFDYSGYGRSEGWICPEFCEADLVAAYAEVRRRVGAAAKVYVLGFSLGSGIAAHGVAALEPKPAGLILCEAFTTFREAARAAFVPSWLGWAVPGIWDTVEAVRRCDVPLLVVHSDGDRLFPVAMGRRIAEAAGAELLVVRGYGHDDLYRTPEDGYWVGVVEWMLRHVL